MANPAKADAASIQDIAVVVIDNVANCIAIAAAVLNVVDVVVT